jgi:LytS/YehU family sensor histidine kinase
MTDMQTAQNIYTQVITRTLKDARTALLSAEEVLRSTLQSHQQQVAQMEEDIARKKAYLRIIERAHAAGPLNEPVPLGEDVTDEEADVAMVRAEHASAAKAAAKKR